jgi:hypothetical protein
MQPDENQGEIWLSAPVVRKGLSTASRKWMILLGGKLGFRVVSPVYLLIMPTAYSRAVLKVAHPMPPEVAGSCEVRYQEFDFLFLST